MNKQRKVVITTTYNEMGIIIDTKAEEVAQPDLQPTCNELATDTISRQAAIDALDEIRHALWEIDIPSPTVPEYVEHHEQVQSVWKLLDKKQKELYALPSVYSLDVISDYLKKYFMPYAQPTQPNAPNTLRSLDCIDRQAAIDIFDDYNISVENGELEAYSRDRKRLCDLPSVQPETCDTCKHGYFGDEQCNDCRVRFVSHYERRTDER